MVKEVKPGDAIRCMGITVVIEKIYYAHYFGGGHDDDGWMIEFVDSNGNYRYWKQYLDGGEIIYKVR